MYLPASFISHFINTAGLSRPSAHSEGRGCINIRPPIKDLLPSISEDGAQVVLGVSSPVSAPP